jgi:hypothetical protein
MVATLTPFTSAMRAGGDASKARIKTDWMRRWSATFRASVSKCFSFAAVPGGKSLGGRMHSAASVTSIQPGHYLFESEMVSDPHH